MKKSSSVVTEELLEFIYGGCFAQGSLRFHHSFHLRLFMAWILVLSSHTSMNSLSDSRVDLGFHATRMVLSRAKLRISLWSFSTKLQFWVHLVELSVSLRVSMGSIEMVKSWQFSREPRAHFSSSFAIVTLADRLQSLRIEECCLVYWCSAEIFVYPFPTLLSYGIILILSYHMWYHITWFDIICIIFWFWAKIGYNFQAEV